MSRESPVRRHEQTFLQRKRIEGQQIHQKMLSITRHQGNVNQDHNKRSQQKITSHLWEWLKQSKKTQETSVGEAAEEKESLCTVGGNASWCSHCGKQMEGLQNVKDRPTYHMIIYAKSTKTLVQKDTYTPILIAALFTRAKIWKPKLSNNLSAPLGRQNTWSLFVSDSMHLRELWPHYCKPQGPGKQPHML